MEDKVRLLMEETGCDSGEAELALSQSGWDVARAVQSLPSLLKNISLAKGSFHAFEGPLFGLYLVIWNRKTGQLVRARAVVSYHPGVALAGLDEEWFEFEKRLYGGRLSEGSLQTLSLDLERALSESFSSTGFDGHPLLAGEAAAAEFLSRQLRLPPGTAVEVKQKSELLDLAQIQLRRPSDRLAGSPARQEADGPFLVSVALEGDDAGKEAGALKAGDYVFVQVIDARDIAQSLAKLLGGRAAEGLIALCAPVESAEAQADGTFRVRARLSPGVCGDAVLPGTLRVKTAAKGPEVSWWKKLLPF